MDDLEVGQTIKAAREEAGFTQAEAGGIVHLSGKSISDRERGRTGFRLSEVLELQKQGVVNLKIFD